MHSRDAGKLLTSELQDIQQVSLIAFTKCKEISFEINLFGFFF